MMLCGCSFSLKLRGGEVNCCLAKESVCPSPSRGSPDERVRKVKANSKVAIALRPTVWTINGSNSVEGKRGGDPGKVL